MQQYEEFLQSKRRVFDACGIQVADKDLHPKLFDFQKDVVRWALAKGRETYGRKAEVIEDLEPEVEAEDDQSPSSEPEQEVTASA